MSTIFGALAPVSMLILLGLILRRIGFLEEAGWAALERLVYYVLFPILLFLELARAELGQVPVARLVVAMIAVQLTMALLATLTRHGAGLAGPTYTSLLQGLVRWNSYVAIALVPLMFGHTAAPLAALAVAVLTPVANLMSVAALARHGHSAGGGVRGFAKAVITNPLIVCCVLGIVWAALGLPLPAILGDTLGILAQGTLAIGLLAVGAGLRPIRLQAHSAPLLAAILGKLVLSPLLALGLGLLLGVEGVALAVLVLVSGVPTSSSSYILARLMGGDAELMAAIVTAQTALALVTLPAVLLLAGA
jgi:malonate transporter and related proteins